MNTRSYLYWLARLLGDITAIRKNKVGRRIGRRTAGRISKKYINRLFR